MLATETLAAALDDVLAADAMLTTSDRAAAMTPTLKSSFFMSSPSRDCDPEGAHWLLSLSKDSVAAEIFPRRRNAGSRGSVPYEVNAGLEPAPAEGRSVQRLLDPGQLGDHIDRLYRAAWALSRLA